MLHTAHVLIHQCNPRTQTGHPGAAEGPERPVRGGAKQDEDVGASPIGLPINICPGRNTSQLYAFSGLARALLAVCSRGAFVHCGCTSWCANNVATVSTCPTHGKRSHPRSPLLVPTLTTSYPDTPTHRTDDRSTGIAAGGQADKACHDLYHVTNDKDGDDLARPSAATSASALSLAQDGLHPAPSLHPSFLPYGLPGVGLLPLAFGRGLYVR